MKKKIVSFLISCAVIILMLAGCVQPSWEAEDFKYLGENAEMGPMFEVGGITYRYLPETFWVPIIHKTDKYLGKVFSDKNIYPGGWEFYIYNFEKKDVNKIFVILKGRKEHWYDDADRPVVYYYRADITLPPFDRTGIDKVGYEYWDQDGIKSIVGDSGVVDKLFDVISTASNNQDFDLDNRYGVALLWFMNSNFPGIGIYSHVYACGQDYWIEIKPPIRLFHDSWSVVENIKIPDTVYAKIPQELLEQFAGKKLPTASEYIASQQKTSS
jgi:hypothetical protein